jgi:sensor histidine kinase YesM
VRIEVKDNGPGIPADQTLEARRGRGVGLANTRARLEGLYGNAASFELTNDPSGGLVVTLEIPRNSEL